MALQLILVAGACVAGVLGLPHSSGCTRAEACLAGDEYQVSLARSRDPVLPRMLCVRSAAHRSVIGIGRVGLGVSWRHLKPRQRPEAGQVAGSGSRGARAYARRL